jgi:hypothetical protein
MMIERVRIQTSLKRPLCIRSVAIFANLDHIVVIIVLDASHETSTILIMMI